MEANNFILKMICLMSISFSFKNVFFFFSPKSSFFHFFPDLGLKNLISNNLVAQHKSWKSLKTWIFTYFDTGQKHFLIFCI